MKHLLRYEKDLLNPPRLPPEVVMECTPKSGNPSDYRPICWDCSKRAMANEFHIMRGTE